MRSGDLDVRLGPIVRGGVAMIRDPAQAQSVEDLAGATRQDEALTLQGRRRSSCLYAGNAPYIEAQYELYLADATQVAQDWRDYFDALKPIPSGELPAQADIDHAGFLAKLAPAKAQMPIPGSSDTGLLDFARKQVAVQSLVAAYRMVGTRQARLDPLHWLPAVTIPELAPAYHGLADSDLDTIFSAADTFFGDEHVVLGDLLGALQ